MKTTKHLSRLAETIRSMEKALAKLKTAYAAAFPGAFAEAEQEREARLMEERQKREADKKEHDRVRQRTNFLNSSNCPEGFQLSYCDTRTFLKEEVLMVATKRNLGRCEVKVVKGCFDSDWYGSSIGHRGQEVEPGVFWFENGWAVFTREREGSELWNMCPTCQGLGYVQAAAPLRRGR